MSPVTLSLILLRVLSVYLVARGLLFIPEIVTAWAGVSAYGGEWPSLWLFSILVATPLLFGVILWSISPRLAKMIVGAPKPSDDLVASSISNIQAAIFATVGMLLILVTIPSLISIVLQIFGEGGKSNTAAMAHLCSQVVKLVIGVSLVVGSNYFVRVIRRFREFGLEQKNL